QLWRAASIIKHRIFLQPGFPETKERPVKPDFVSGMRRLLQLNEALRQLHLGTMSDGALRIARRNGQKYCELVGKCLDQERALKLIPVKQRLQLRRQLGGESDVCKSGIRSTVGRVQILDGTVAALQKNRPQIGPTRWRRRHKAQDRRRKLGPVRVLVVAYLHR